MTKPDDEKISLPLPTKSFDNLILGMASIIVYWVIYVILYQNPQFIFSRIYFSNFPDFVYVIFIWIMALVPIITLITAFHSGRKRLGKGMVIGFAICYLFGMISCFVKFSQWL